MGTWRGAAKGKRYEVSVAPFATLTKATWVDVEAEAGRVAHVRCHEAEVVVEAGKAH